MDIGKDEEINIFRLTEVLWIGLWNARQTDDRTPSLAHGGPHLSFVLPQYFRQQKILKETLSLGLFYHWIVGSASIASAKETTEWIDAPGAQRGLQPSIPDSLVLVHS